MGRLNELWSQMAGSQRLILLALLGAVIVTLMLFFAWLGKEDFTLLYADLTPEDSARVIEILQKRNVEYRVSSGGTGIMVPASRVAEMKVALAGEGLPTGGTAGYELFDNQGLGVSEFTQNVNYRRALEGELARSIGTINSVTKARVHLVIPERALFKEDRRTPTASVVLNLSHPGSLRPDQVVAIQRLIGSSVEGLAPEQVTILDSFGNLLSKDRNDELSNLSSAQLEIKQEVESYLGRKAQTTLESVLGPGEALVRVNAELDFEKVERTREVVDPEVAVVLSEQREQSQREAEGESSESSTVNYEFNRLVENIIGATGGIKQLTVAVLVNGTYQGEGEQAAYVPRNPQELDGYRKVVENIVGFNAQRGDKIEVLNVQFHDTALPEDGGGLMGGGWLQKVPNLLNRGLVIVALLFLLLTFRKMGAQLVAGLSSPGRVMVAAPAGAGRVAVPQASETRNTLSEEELSRMELAKEAERQMQMEEQAKAMALERPEDIAQLVRTWMKAGR